ncbi:uncharacterized protein Nmlp_1830 [Natronomonas moolapensis 8.8.11]|uniref:ArsR family transcriptional regulator n=1 Tax=Natronomonas moolapensis (strain DSM 18674 / CECT 7526 / JCM 14361 / 8.8.11) TaxID=268739 RepID=M1Y0M5_NATM8|nr:hypothetical protein [Natronomonas moolapensis]CCQ36018.1 uncharacterized protein Nmlp_1830 [Natronomonas moolapensis 8.8.11]
MAVRRREVLEHLAAASDAERRETTTTETLTAALDAERRAVETQLKRLTGCELARTYPDGRVRVTITGEELLELDTEGTLIVDEPNGGSEL